MSEKLSPERAVRLLKAKAAELENLSVDLNQIDPNSPALMRDVVRGVTADIALVAQLLADLYERHDQLINDVTYVQTQTTATFGDAINRALR